MRWRFKKKNIKERKGMAGRGMECKDVVIKTIADNRIDEGKKQKTNEVLKETNSQREMVGYERSKQSSLCHKP